MGAVKNSLKKSLPGIPEKKLQETNIFPLNSRYNKTVKTYEIEYIYIDIDTMYLARIYFTVQALFLF